MVALQQAAVARAAVGWQRVVRAQERQVDLQSVGASPAPSMGLVLFVLQVPEAQEGQAQEWSRREGRLPRRVSCSEVAVSRASPVSLSDSRRQLSLVWLPRARWPI